MRVSEIRVKRIRVNQGFGVQSIHYHLQVQANPQKWHKKTNAIFSILGRNLTVP